jgi:hypothetical protein
MATVPLHFVTHKLALKSLIAPPVAECRSRLSYLASWSVPVCFNLRNKMSFIAFAMVLASLDEVGKVCACT